MSAAKRLCDFCGAKNARVRRIIRNYGRGRGEYLVRNIPTISCADCGATYVTATTVRKLERNRANHRRLAVKRRIAIADFASTTRRTSS
jgi:YgiT-type zinc finger domain-containing protein